MKSYILLENIEIYAHHGVFRQETVVGNTFILNIKLKVDVQNSANSDRLQDTVSYADIYNIINQEMKIPARLLEHIGGRILKTIKKDFPQIEEIELKISKKNPPLGGQVEYASVILID